jgi:MFS family permease
MSKKLWNRDFILLLQSSAVSMLGDVMYSVAIGYWVYEKTGSSALMGIMSSMSMFITMFLSPFCGSIVDKLSRKWLMVGIDLLQGLMMLGIGALAFLNSLSVPVVLIAALVASFGSVFYSPAVSTLMLDIIPRDDMVRGQSLASGGSSLLDLVGTAFGGAMVAFLGVPLIVVINGLSNLYAAASEIFIRVPRTVQQGETITVKGVLGDTVSAVRLILSDKCLKLFVSCSLIINLLAAGPLTLLLPFCMEKGFSVDMYGYLVATYSVASLIAVLILGVVKLKPLARFWVMALGFTLSIPTVIMAYCADKFLPMCIFAFLSGFLNCAGNSVFNASLMLALPEQNRSATIGFIRSASIGGTALSALVYGFLGEIVPLYLVFSIGCALAIVPMLIVSFSSVTRRFIIENCN